MRGVNKVIIIGNLGNDPEARQFDNGGSVTNISVATSEQWTDKQSGEKREATEWHRIALFNRLGEIAAQYLRKGSKVYIEGSLRTRKYEKDGKDHYVTEIRADQMQMLDGKNDNQQSGGYQNNQQGYQQPPQGNQAPNPYANQVAQNAQGMQGQVNQQFANANQNTQLNQNQQANVNAGFPPGPVDDDIPFAPFYDGQL